MQLIKFLEVLEEFGTFVFLHFLVKTGKHFM
jgi:hypothetical protein